MSLSSVICFAVVGLIVGFLQYALIKTAVLYAEKSKGGAVGVIGIKLFVYAVIAAILLIWFDNNDIIACIGGIATGLIVTAIVEILRGKKKTEK